MDFNITNAVDFSVYIGLWFILWVGSSSVVRSGIVVCPSWKSAPSSSSAADDMT